MGCATSKQKKKLCQNCQGPYSPVRRSYSLHERLHPRRSTNKDDDDFHHVVALTSSTLGSLKLDFKDKKHRIKEEEEEEPPTNHHHHHTGCDNDNNGVTVKLMSKEEELMEAMKWSKMIDEKIPKIIPKTPTITPPGEPETINTWELMEGLEDNAPPHHLRSFSFCVRPSNIFQAFGDQQQTPRVHEETIKPFWSKDTDDESNSNSNGTSIVSEFDPEVISSFRKALEELPPANPFHLKPLDGNNDHQVMETLDNSKELSGGGKKRLIVYFTSLRGVRKTYEDCCNVRVILKGLGLKVDERDVSMHSGFKDELKELVGEGWKLPKVFIGSRYIGGAEEIRRMNEDGELEKVVQGCERVDEGGDYGGGTGAICQACGDIRFVPCDTCSGSCKIYYEGDFDDNDDDEEQEHEDMAAEDVDFGFQRCPDCNENGLIRCPICCD